ncbi:Protein of unknown function [Escherichia coli D6-113.11]|nr:Protein of unknown function [Escherichia coli D6-113.11]CDU36248.1 Protein of unknown function [Escherichia coli D6-113.11]
MRQSWVDSVSHPANERQPVVGNRLSC